MSSGNNNSIYTQEELEQLELIKKTRLNIITHMTKDGVPERSGDIRVLNEVMTSADKMIADSASIRVKQNEAANNGMAIEMVAEMLRQSRSNKLKYEGSGKAPTITPEVAKVSVVDGETDLNPEPLKPEEFVAPSFDPSKVD